jgi:hypothetical protein
MDQKPTAQSVRRRDWDAVLGAIDKEAGRALSNLDKREATLAAHHPSTTPKGQVVTERAEPNEASTRIEDSYGQAQEAARELETSLKTGEESLRAWLAAAGSLRHRLANWVVPSV